MSLQTNVLKAINELHIFRCTLMLFYNFTRITHTRLLLIPLTALCPVNSECHSGEVDIGSDWFISVSSEGRVEMLLRRQTCGH